MARKQWSGSEFQTALRNVPTYVRAGRLADVLSPAAPLLEFVDTAGMRDTLLALRQLIDALAAD